MEQGLSLSTVALLAIPVIGFYVFVIRQRSPSPDPSPDPNPGPTPIPNAPPLAPARLLPRLLPGSPRPRLAHGPGRGRHLFHRAHRR